MNEGSTDTRTDPATPEVRRVSLAKTWPEITAGVRESERLLVERALQAPIVTAQGPDLAAAMREYSGEAFNFLIVAGAVLKWTRLQGRSALELFSPGDVLAPALPPDRQIFVRATSEYEALDTASVAVLEGRFELVAQRWPTVSAYLHQRLAEQTHRSSMHLGILHQRRAHDRILALFADFSERFGRMTAGGVIIELPVTHELIGHFIGSSRPTVSFALADLDERGELRRLDDGRWQMRTQ